MSARLDAERCCATSARARPRRLARRPDLELAVLELRRAVLRLERRVRDERIGVRGLDHLRAAAAKRRVDVAVLARIRCAGGLRRRAPPPASRTPRCSAAPSALRPTRPSASRARVCAGHQRVGDDRDAAEQAVRARACPRRRRRACTPGSALISSRLALATLPPNTGHFSNTAYSIPGTVTSMPKSGLPVTIAGLSTPAIGLPMILIVLRVLERDGLRGPARGSVAALRRELAVAERPVRSPRASPRPARSCTRPRARPTSAAAAAISICARRRRRPGASASQLFGVACCRRRPARPYFDRVDVGLLDRDLLPVDVELLGDQHRQHRLDALADLGVLGDDRDRAVGVMRMNAFGASGGRRRRAGACACRASAARGRGRAACRRRRARRRAGTTRRSSSMRRMAVVAPTLSGQRPAPGGRRRCRRRASRPPRRGSPRGCAGRWRSGRGCRSSRRRCRRRSASASSRAAPRRDMIWPAWQ